MGVSLHHLSVEILLAFLECLRCLKSHNVIDLEMLRALISKTANLKLGEVIKAIVLVGFFGFLRLSNLAPHSKTSFDPSRHLFFTQDYVKILLKWSKTLQTRDKVHVITLPKLKDTSICPWLALKCLFQCYQMSSTTSLFQIHTSSGWSPLPYSAKIFIRSQCSLGFEPSPFHFPQLAQVGCDICL